MHIFRPDEIADIWIRRIIKAIRLQLNYFGGRGVHFVNVKRGGSRGQVLSVEEEVCVCVSQTVTENLYMLRVTQNPTCDLNISYNCPKTSHQWICRTPLRLHNMV